MSINIAGIKQKTAAHKSKHTLNINGLAINLTHLIFIKFGSINYYLRANKYLCVYALCALHAFNDPSHMNAVLIIYVPHKILDCFVFDHAHSSARGSIAQLIENLLNVAGARIYVYIEVA